ncbi:MAG TPA: DUF554 family protein [Candidatus Saccharimonadales bacterium]|nr:DUF554 family protein [Candidatus Saccharimonadales bacterium]
MTGVFLNALGILFGGLFGLALRQPLSLRLQIFLRSALGAFTVFSGLCLVWVSVSATFFSSLRQTFIATLALIVGSLLGKLLRLQKISNRLGRYAGKIISSGQSGAPRKVSDGFNACAVLFCAAPLGLVGAVADGLSNYPYLLAVKAIMDGLATMGFVKNFGWPTALAAFPVLFFLGAITLACQIFAKPLLVSHGLIDPVSTIAGLIACAVALVIFEVRKVELANFLPSLVIAPLLTWLFNH